MQDTSINKARESKESVDKKDINKTDLGADIVNAARGSVESADTSFEVGALIPSEKVGENTGDGDIKPARTQQQDDQKKEEEIRKRIKRDPKKLSNGAVKYLVTKAINKEIQMVQKEVHDLSEDVVGNAFELSEALKRLKRLRLIMKNLAHWTMEFIRSIFQRKEDGENFSDMSLVQD